MESTDEASASCLQAKERELKALRQKVAQLEQEVADTRRREASESCPATSSAAKLDAVHRSYGCSHGLSKEQVQRYSRHLLLPSFGLNPQERLCKGSVLIVGCGGLGSPAAMYLAASGVGKCSSVANICSGACYTAQK